YEDNYLFVNRMANENLKWEKTEALNFGFDFSFKEGLISGSLDVYKSSTKDLLVDRKLPEVTGFRSITTNLGQVDNKGIELLLSSKIKDKTNFSWDLNFNFSLNRNKIKHLYGDIID